MTAEEWQIWRQQFEAFADVTELGSRQAGYQVSVLKAYMSTSAFRVYNGLPFASAEEQKNLKKTLDLFEEHYVGKCNEIYERYVYHT